MGAESFITTRRGRNRQDAFLEAVKQAQYEYGHRGYTGTIAEKTEYVSIQVPEGLEPRFYAKSMIDNCDSRIYDKWGPAGCIDLGGDEYLFFGWASS